MGREIQQNFIQNAAFDDFDNFASAAKAWDLDFRQLDKGDFRAEIKQVFTESVQLGSAKIGRHMEQQGSPPPNFYTFAVLAEPTSLVWRKQAMPDYFIMLYAPGSEIDCVSQSGFNVFTFSLTEAHIEDVLRSLELPGQRRLFDNKDAFSCSRSTWAELSQTFNMSVQMIFSNAPQPLNPFFQKQLDYELPRTLLRSVAAAQSIEPQLKTRQKRSSFNRVMDFIEANKQEPLTVNALCTVAGVTERALEYSFKRYLGVSPKSYLKALRLNGVRRALRQADPAATKVSDVANHWGFWHMGKLAADYREFFGELPSETLRK